MFFTQGDWEDRATGYIARCSGLDPAIDKRYFWKSGKTGLKHGALLVAPQQCQFQRGNSIPHGFHGHGEAGPRMNFPGAPCVEGLAPSPPIQRQWNIKDVTLREGLYINGAVPLKGSGRVPQHLLHWVSRQSVWILPQTIKKQD